MALRDPARKVKSATTAFDIVEFVHEQDGATLADLTEHLDLAKSTVHSYLATLESREYLVREGGTYRLGLKFLYHGIAARRSIRLSTVARDTLRALADETSLAAWLLVEEHGRAVYLRKELGTESTQTYGRVSKRTGLHVLAGGKAIMAHLPPARLESILDHYGLPAQTEHTVTDESDLRDELRTIRSRGYATSRHEAALGVQSVAAPVTVGNDVLGAVHVSGMTNQVDDDYFETSLPGLVVEATDELADRYERVHS